MLYAYAAVLALLLIGALWLGAQALRRAAAAEDRRIDAQLGDVEALRRSMRRTLMSVQRHG